MRVWATGSTVRASVGVEAQEEHHSDTREEGDCLGRGARPIPMSVDLRDQVDRGDVDEAPGRDGQERGRKTLDALTYGERHRHPYHCDEGRGQVEHQCAPDRQSAVDEHGEVADLLWDLVEGYGHGRGQSGGGVDEIRRADHHPVDEVVRRITDQVHDHHRVGLSALVGEPVAGSMRVGIRILQGRHHSVMMEPEVSLEQKEGKKPGEKEQGEIESGTQLLDGLGKQMEGRTSDQEPRGETDEDRQTPS